MSLLDYIKGNKKGKDAHRLEKEAMKDPFLSDALEGFDSVGGNHLERIARIQEKIAGKTRKKSNYLVIKWSIAASILLCIGLGGYFINRYNSFNPGGNLYSKSESKKDKINIQAPLQTEKAREDLQVLREIQMQSEENTKEMAETSVKQDQIIQSEPVSEESSLKMQSPQSITMETSAEFIKSEVSPALEGIDIADSEERSVMNSNSIKTILQGRITDNTGEPLTGVSIVQEKTGAFTISDINGDFKLETYDTIEPVTAQYVGFESIEIPIDSGKGKPMFIAMNEDKTALDEVVVTGYSTQKRSDLITGSAHPAKKNNIRPEPVKGMKEYEKYLKKNQIRPEDPSCNGIKGKVQLSFYVDDSGRPHNIQVKKPLCPALDNEAIRLVNEGPMWKTGDKEVTLQVEFR